MQRFIAVGWRIGMKTSGGCSIRRFCFGLSGFFSTRRKSLETGHQSKLAVTDGRVSLIKPLYIIKSNRERRVNVKVGCLRRNLYFTESN